jgi:hypothetical protein
VTRLAIQVSLMVAALFTAFALHECGHLAAGKLMGYRFRLLALGPLWIVRSPAGLRIYWRWSPIFWGPMAAAMPKSADRYASRIAWYIAGGPVASVIVAIAALVVSQLTHGESRLFLRTLALASTCVFVATSQPYGTGIGVASDGGRLLRYATDREAALNVAAAMTLEALEAEGVVASAEIVNRAAKAPAARIPAAIRLPD